MYMCDQCGELREELPEYVEHYPWGSTTVSETFVEDECGCGGFFECASVCVECDEYYVMGTGVEGCCPDCVKSAQDDLKKFMEHYSENIQDVIVELIKYGDY